MTITISRKNKLTAYISAGVLLLFFIISLCCFLIKGNKKRFLYIFPSAEENQYFLETRYVNKYNKKISELSAYEYYINQYIDDLLLGSTLERTKLLFKSGTKSKSCFLRDDVLYLDLSKDLLTVDSEAADIREGVNLLYTNIKKNFKRVKNIELYVDGVYAFEKDTLK